MSFPAGNIRAALLVVAVIFISQDRQVAAQRQRESLDRGTVAVHQGDGKVFVSWRLLATDPAGVAFNVYRTAGDGEPTKVNAEPIAASTNFVDSGVDVANTNAYTIRPVIGGKEQAASEPFVLPADAPVMPPSRNPCAGSW